MDRVFDRIFRPLARLAMAKGLRYADVAERLRRAFLGVAMDQAGVGAPVSRLSVLSGLQRRDIKGMLEAPDAGKETRPDPLARIVALWLAQHDGAVLVRHGEDGSFDRLARMVRQDVHPRSFLDALEEAGTVAVDGDTVRLLKHAHVPLEGSEAQIDYLARNVGDHLAASVGNVLGEAPAFDLAVHYNGLSAEAVAELEALWRARMRPVLEEMNALAEAHQAQGDGAMRFRAGGYFRKESDR